MYPIDNDEELNILNRSNGPVNYAETSFGRINIKSFLQDNRRTRHIDYDEELYRLDKGIE